MPFSELSNTFLRVFCVNSLMLTSFLSASIFSFKWSSAAFLLCKPSKTLENKKAGITLAGTLTIPFEDGQYPVVILISGSGPQNRDSELLGHRPFLVLSDYLTRNGIAVLRFDDRGTASSKGNFQSATSADYASDVEAGIEYLKTRKEIKKASIGLIGHSEGGLIAASVQSVAGSRMVYCPDFSSRNTTSSFWLCASSTNSLKER